MTDQQLVYWINSSKGVGKQIVADWLLERNRPEASLVRAIGKLEQHVPFNSTMDFCAIDGNDHFSNPVFKTNLSKFIFMFYFTLAINENKEIVYWGTFRNQTVKTIDNIKDVIDIVSNGYYTLAFTEGGCVWEIERKRDSFHATYLQKYKYIKQIANGSNHTVMINKHNKLIQTGESYAYQKRNYPSYLSGVTQVECGFNHSLALTEDGKVHAWGNNTHLQCNVPADLDDIVEIGCGNNLSFALRRDGKLFSWGDGVFPGDICNVIKIVSGIGDFCPLAITFHGYNYSNVDTRLDKLYMNRLQFANAVDLRCSIQATENN